MISKLNSKPVFWYTLGTIMRQLSAFIMLPVYTRYLSPAEYGIIGLLAMILGLYEIFLGARFGNALPKFYYDTDDTKNRKALISTALLFTTSVSLLGGTVFALSAQPLSEHFFERTDLVWAVAAYGVILISSSIEEYALVFLRLRDKPFYFFALAMFKLALQLSLNIYFVVVLEWGVQGVIYGTIIASLVLALISGVYTFWYTGFHFQPSQAKALWSFTWPLWLAGLGAIYINFVSNFLIKYFASLEAVGFYHFALKFSSLIALMVWRPFNQWWQTERFKIARHSAAPQQEFAAAFTLISSILLVAVVGVSLLAGVVIDIMADAAYAPAKDVVPVLCMMVLFGQLNFFVQFAFLKSGKTGFFPKIKLVKAIGITITVTAGTYWWGVMGAVAAMALCQGLDFVFTQWFGQRHYDQGLPMVRFYSLTFATFAFIQAVQMLAANQPDFLVKSGMLVGGCILYVLILGTFIVCWRNTGSELKRFVRQRMA